MISFFLSFFLLFQFNCFCSNSFLLFSRLPPLSLSLPLSFSLSLSICLSIYLSISLSLFLFLSLSMTLSLFLSLSLPFSLSLYLCRLSLSLPISVCVCLSDSLSLSLVCFLRGSIYTTLSLFHTFFTHTIYLVLYQFSLYSIIPVLSFPFSFPPSHFYLIHGLVVFPHFFLFFNYNCLSAFCPTPSGTHCRDTKLTITVSH
ncbi:unnamed protein product [Acanthosepion pharaonis]|uniref:Uncharacterized protein n=1 Tax=Acanthosepion pharaonis TaxID=158019 RepID=A0A812CTR7_ACAPH|nr:unnamed protein product [Sepia pharaonis]